ncbi:MAG: Gfo/Idh/MocA family oxidoreductase [Chloroflexota bacterium]
MRIGMMSFAHLHAEAYIGNLRAIHDVEMIGIADDNTERGQHFANQFGAPFFSDYDSLLAEKPDGVVICCENNRHREQVEMALAAGVKHILCEKPLATTLEDAQAIVQQVDAAHATLMTAFPMRFSPPIREAYATIRAGKLGNIIGCNATNQGENPGYHRDWFVDKRLSGGGAVMDHTVHVVDLMRWIFDSEIAEIYAEADSADHPLFAAPGLHIDTAGILMITFTNGTFVGLDCSWSRPNYYPTWGNVRIDFVGERGLIVVDSFAQHHITFSQPNRRPLWDYWGSDTNQALIDEFAASIRENRQPMITGRDGLKAVEAVLAAYQSAETHDTVKLA